MILKKKVFKLKKSADFIKKVTFFDGSVKKIFRICVFVKIFMFWSQFAVFFPNPLDYLIF